MRSRKVHQALHILVERLEVTAVTLEVCVCLRRVHVGRLALLVFEREAFRAAGWVVVVLGAGANNVGVCDKRISL